MFPSPNPRTIILRVTLKIRGGSSLHIRCRNSARTRIFTKSSLVIHFYLRTIRGKLNEITLECDVLLKVSARFNRAFDTPDPKRLS